MNQDKYGGLYNENSDVLLKTIIATNQRYDLIITDPPYNVGKDFGNDSDCLPLDEYLAVSAERINMCSQLLKDEGSVIWFGIHRYIGFIQTMLYDAGLYYRRMNIWHYNNGFSRTKKEPAMTYEPFLWFSKSEKQWVYNADDVRVPYKSQERLKTPVYFKDKKGNRKEWRANPLGALRGDIWEYPTLSGKTYAAERTEHPTQKPEALITEIVKAYCPKNEEGYYQGSILDPFHGSGTLGVCCEKLNLNGSRIEWTGIEIEQVWHELARRRLEDIIKDKCRPKGHKNEEHPTSV